MQKSTSIKSLALIGAVVIAFTLAVFFLLGLETSAINLWAFGFLLFAEIVLFGSLIGMQFAGSNHNSVFMAAGLTTALALYFFVTLILTFLSGLFKGSENAFVLIELAVITLFAITTIAIFAFSRGISDRNKEDAAKIGSTEAKRGGF